MDYNFIMGLFSLGQLLDGWADFLWVFCLIDNLLGFSELLENYEAQLVKKDTLERNLVENITM